MEKPDSESQTPAVSKAPPERNPEKRPSYLKIVILLVCLVGVGAVALEKGWLPWTGKASVSKGEPKYHCPMHPTVVSDRPGSCPICGMDLVPIGQDAHNTAEGVKSTVPGLSVVSITPQTRQLMGLKLGAVEKRPLAREVRTSARIVADETRLWRVTTKMEGWVEKLFVGYTGQEVKSGDPLLSIYSPELFSAQSEYISALQGAGNAKPNASDAIATAVRRRFELWDISSEQIERLERTGKVEKNLTLYASTSGVVTSRNVLAGQKIMPGEPLMVISDLSVLWADADIYQSDLPYVKVGMPLELTLPYWPGKVFDGKVIFVSPMLDLETRTLRARLEIPNREGILKPGMFGDARLHYVLGEKLSIPASAVMFGGRRTYAFRDMDKGHLVPVEIKIGTRSGDFYELLEGLKEGDQVVVSANFLVDSESNLKAALEAMTGAGQDAGDVSSPPAEEIAGEKLPKLLPAYLDIQKALAADNLSKATSAAARAKDAGLKSVEIIATTTDLIQARAAFYDLSRSILATVEKTGAPPGQALFRFYCPMARDNKGGEWLQSDQEVRNPYFGSWMLECGEMKGQIPTQGQMRSKSEIPSQEKKPQIDPHAGHVR